MKKIVIILSVFFLLSFSALAEDFDGYIVKIKENPVDVLMETSTFSDSAYLFSDLSDEQALELMSDEIDGVEELNYEHKLLKVADEESLETLMSLGLVESYEEDIYLELFDYDVTKNANYNYLWYLDHVGIKPVWNMGIYGKGVRVGVIDSGVYDHVDIDDNIAFGKSYSTSDSDFTNDGANHGTLVAGIIAAECNDIATVGIAFESDIIALKVADGTKFSLSNAVTALYEAVDVYNCDVINLSFGTNKLSDNLYAAIKYAINKGAIVVAAAGNYGDKTVDGVYNPPQYPAYFDEVISVANVYPEGSTLRVYSSSTFNDKVTIAAPGYSITSLSNSGGISTQIGTSFSAPIVSGAAALAKSIDPDITQAEFMAVLKKSADSSHIKLSGQNSNKWGAGLLDIEAMVNELTKMPGDANDDGRISVSDATVILRYLAGYKDGIDEKLLDVSGDGRVSVSDATLILRHLAGYKVDFK